MDASCWLIYKSLERSCSSVYNISDISRVTVQEVSFSPFLWNPPYFSDSDACSSPSLGLLPCNGIESIIMAFQPSNNASFPPRAYARVALSSGSPAIGVASNAEPSNLGLSPNTFQTFDFSVKPGEVLYVNLLYTINYPVQGNFYYDYSYQTYNAPSLFMLNNTAAWIYVNARTEIVTKNVEKYVLPFGNLLGLIGGLYGVIVSVFAILFGMGAITPWYVYSLLTDLHVNSNLTRVSHPRIFSFRGIVPRYILYAGLAKNMKKEFNEAEGLDKSGSPLSDIIPEADLRNPQYDAAALRNDVDYLRNRLRKLERVLELYYLDKGLLSHIASGEGPHASDANYYDDQQTKFPATAHYEMTTNSS